MDENSPSAAPGYTDDREQIPDEADLLRRIPPWHVVRDENRGGRLRPSSAAFEDDAEGHPMSVRVRPLLHRLGFSDASVLAGHPSFTLVKIQAGTARGLGQLLCLWEAPGEPAHALVVGKKHKKRVCQPLALSAEWVVGPDDHR